MRSSSATTVPWVKQPEHHLYWSSQRPSNSRQLDGFGTHDQEGATLRTGNELERDAALHIIADRVVSEERTESFKPAPLVAQTSKQVLVRKGLIRIPVLVEEAVKKVELQKLTANDACIDKDLSVDLKTLFICAIHKIVY